MKQANIEVMRKILYAVESGGQVYGKQNYKAFAGVGANTSNEKAITIGAGQWYANEARQLLQLIQEKYPSEFSKLDTAGIAADLEKSWSAYGVTATSVKGKCIIAIISSASGIKCQDALMESQITDHAASIGKTYGSMADTAMMECINIIHQGGCSALKRILAKTSKPYTAKTIYAALNTDPADRSNNNQVGDYVTRQKKVYEFITKYASDGGSTSTGGSKSMTEAEARKKPVAYLQKYLGIKEGSAEHKAILAVFNNSKLCTRYTMTVNDAWCATAVSAAFIASGLTDIFPCVECSCPNMISKAKTAGIWVENDAYKPSMGDVIMYDWQDSGSGDNTGVADHVGIVESVSGSTIKVIEGNKNDTVDYRTPEVNGKYIRGYITPDFSKVGSSGTSADTTDTTTTEKKTTTTTETGGNKYMFSVGTVKKGSTGNDVKLLQRLLKSNGFKGQDGKALSIDGDAGANTIFALRAYQKKKGLTVDGSCGSATWKSILLR